MLVIHQSNRPADHIAQKNLLYLCRLQRVWNQDHGVIAPTHNVDPLTSQFASDILDPISSHSNASADAINTLIRAAHRHLAAIAWLSTDGVDTNHPI